MKSIELWNNLKKSNEVIKNNNIYYIFPKDNIKIKNFGVIKFLKKDGEKVTIECNETLSLKTTEDHVFTDTNKTDIFAKDFNIGGTIFGGENGNKIFTVSSKKSYVKEDFSYDVTTSSEHFMVNNLYSHNCRSLLSALWIEKTYPKDTKFHWQEVGTSNIQYDGAPGKNFDYLKGFGNYSSIPNDIAKGVVINFRGNSGWVKSFGKDADGKDTITVIEPRVFGRWNNGVVTINIPMYAGEAREKVNKLHNASSVDFVEDYKDEYIKQFYEDFDKGLELCHKALLFRNECCKKIKAKNAPLLWMHGGYLREADPEKTLGEMMREHPGYNSISLGFVGLYETCEALIGKSNTTDDGKQLAMSIMKHMNEKVDSWRDESVNFYPSIYGTPEEQTTSRFALALKKHLGEMENVTTHDFVTNSYHVCPSEQITWQKKLSLEGEYLSLCKGGAVSYIETDDLKKNPEVIEEVIRYMNDHISYAEVNTTLGTCYKCGYQGDFYLKSNDKHDTYYFECPKCGNTDGKSQKIVMRLCGYVGEVQAGETTHGRMADFEARQKARHIKIAK